MCSSYLNWPKALLILLVAATACSAPQREWLRVEAVDAGGYTMSAPLSGETQKGRLVLGADTFATHINILADSGVTYVASWFDVPAAWSGLSEQALLDTLWPQVVRHTGAVRLDEPGPWEAGGTVRDGWFLDDGIRLGLVAHVLGSRFVLMDAATPDALKKDRHMANMTRFLRSFEPTK